MRSYLFLIIILALAIPTMAADKFIAVDTPQATIHGEYAFNEEVTGYFATMTLTDAGTYYPFINATVETSRGISFIDDDINGDHLQLDNGTAGLYLIFMGMSFGTSAGSENIHCAVFINDIETNIEYSRVMDAGGDLDSPAQSGLMFLDPGDTVKFKCSADQASKTLTVGHLNFFILRVGTL